MEVPAANDDVPAVAGLVYEAIAMGNAEMLVP